MGDEPDRAEKVRKRPRAARACELCRAKKYRCDERDPCGRCMKFNVPCVYKDADSFRQRLVTEARGHRGQTPETTRLLRGETGEGAYPAYERNTGSSGDSSRCPPNDSHIEREVSEINPYTHNREFHGPTSSLAFLAALQRSGLQEFGATSGSGTQALVSAFHNDSFSPQSAPESEGGSFIQTRYYFRQSQYFLDAYFQNIHYIHPVIDRSLFLSRCEDLWFGRNNDQSQSFVALYFAVMSIGALIREWPEALIDGLGRWEWSRKLFKLASLTMGGLPLSIDLETVQACIIMAKVCQNELNPHLAYSYLGIAVRISLSAGHNRQFSSNLITEYASDDAISKTWWGLYSIEMEISFALGRTDSLGADIYHNRPLPPVLETETAILTPMVELARIIRRVSAHIYTPASSIDENIDFAAGIESELDRWVSSLPISIRPRLHGQTDDPGHMKDSMSAKKQRHTLRFRYYNIMMVLYRPFLLHVSRHGHSKTDRTQDRIDRALAKCITCAGSTIRLMHYMYSSQSYFRTWWYNTTYTLYAASIIIGYYRSAAKSSEKPELVQLVDMSIEVLHAMDENIVAKKAATLLRMASDKMQNLDPHISEAHSCVEGGLPRAHVTLEGGSESQDFLLAQDFFWDSLVDDNFDFTSQIFPMSGGRQFPANGS